MMNPHPARAKVIQADELFQLTMFSWSVSSGGYCWMKGRDLQAPRPGMHLVESSPQREVSDAPIHDGLFREFSDLIPDHGRILGFANKYGMLGKYVLVTAVKREPGEGKWRAVLTGESLEMWLSEIATMYRLVCIWDSISGRGRLKQSELEHEVDYRPDRILYRWKSSHDGGLEVVASKDHQPLLFAKLNENKNKKLSLFLSWYLQITVNQGMRRGYSPARLLWDLQWEKLGLTIVPESLLGLIWLQFAKAIEGDISHRRCEDCGKWFALGGRSGRSDKRYCSGTCKARSHRMKKPRPNK